MFDKLIACIRPRQPPLFGSSADDNVEPIGENFNKYSFPDCNCVLPKRYSNVAPCGNGAFGYVFYAKDNLTDDYVVIKKISQKNMDVKECTQNYGEFKFLSSFNHKNLITLHSAYIPAQTLDDFQNIYLVMPFCRYTLHELIHTDQVHFSHREISFLTYQALCGIRHLRRINIAHRDLKPGNMVVDLETGNLKLIDFGMSRMEVDATMSITGAGTCCYNAPELAFETKSTNKIDIWSLGCVIYEMFTKRIFVLCRNDDEHKMELLRMFGTPDERFLGEIRRSGIQDWIRLQETRPQVVWSQLLPANVFPIFEPDYFLTAQNARDLLHGLLQFNPANRFDVEKALACSYFNGYRKLEDVKIPTNGYDPIVERLGDRTASELKEMLFNEVKQYEREHSALQKPQ